MAYRTVIHTIIMSNNDDNSIQSGNQHRALARQLKCTFPFNNDSCLTDCFSYSKSFGAVSFPAT